MFPAAISAGDFCDFSGCGAPANPEKMRDMVCHFSMAQGFHSQFHG